MTWYQWAEGWIRLLRGEESDHEKRISLLERNGVILLAAIDDVAAAEENLKAVVLGRVTDLQTQVAALQAQIAAGQPDLTAPLEKLAGDMNAFADSLKPATP